MGREEYFLKYNEDNLMKNSLAIEDHARHLKSSYSPEHVSCLLKHALIIEGDSDEAISHSSVSAPEKTGLFIEIRDGIKEFRKGLENSREPEKVIREIRAIRKKVEKLNPNYNLDQCKVCGDISSIARHSGEKIYKQVTLNNSIHSGDGDKQMTDLKKIGFVAGGNFTGKAVTMVSDYIDASMGKTGEVVLKRPSTWINIGAGLLGAVASLYLIKDDTLSLSTAIASTFLLTKGVDYTLEATQPGLGLGPSVRIMGRRAGLHVPAVGGVPEYTDRGLITVD